jgi:hypothetical protein
MKKKVIILLVAVCTFSTIVSSQANYQLTNEQKTWLSKANRHEKNGWIYLHIEGALGKLMSATTTLAPALANSMAQALPIPDPEPVTTTTRLFNFISCFIYFKVLYIYYKLQVAIFH